MQCHRLLRLSNGNSCYNETSSSAVTISTAGRGGAGRRGVGYFASVPGDSLLSEVKNNINKIKGIVFDARQDTGLSLEVNAYYTIYTVMSRHHITRQSHGKSVGRDNNIFFGMAKFKYLETISYNFIHE